MNKTSGTILFVALAMLAFFGTMIFVSGGVFNVTTVTAIPIILSSESIVFILLYATTYHSEAENVLKHS